MLKLYVNGTVYYEVHRNGEVFRKGNFPCSTPGKKFLKNISTEKLVGNVGSDGYQEILKRPTKQYGPKYHGGKDILLEFVQNRSNWVLLGTL